MFANHRMAAIFAAVALFGVFGAVSGCGGADARRASHIAHGQKYLADGKLDKARIEFANALQISPNDPQARYLVGQVTEHLGDIRGAASMYQGAIDADPEYVEPRVSLARLYLFAQNPDKALELTKPAIAKHPDNPELLTVRAVARARLKDRAGALADAQRAVELAPRNEDSVSALAGLYEEDGQRQRAVDLLQTTIKSVPDTVGLRQVLAQVYLSTGDEKLAEEQLQQIVRLRPKELPLRFRLAAFYVGAKRLDDAERTMKEATLAVPQGDTAKLAYVEFLTQYRSAAQGEAVLRDLIVHEPANYDLQLRLAALQQRAGAVQEAVATYRDIIARRNGRPEGDAARDRIAAVDVTIGKSAEAKELVAEVLRNNPGDSDALILRGNMSLREGDPSSAITDLRAVLRDQPHNVMLLRTLARAHLANNERSLAEENLRTAVREAPEDISARVDLGELLARTHHVDEAITLLEQTVKSAPGESGTAARTALAEAYLAKPDLQAARAAAEDLKTLRPDLAIGWYLAGLVAQQQQRPDDAQRELEHALKIQPSATDALNALARLEFWRGQHAKAIALVRDAASQGAGSATDSNLLGELYLADHNYPDAVAALNGAERLAPGWWLPYRNLSLAKFATKDNAGGLAALEAGVKVTHEPTLVIDLATVYAAQGRIDDAIKQYEILHRRSPELAVASNNLAMLLVTYRKDQASLDRARDLTTAFANSDMGALLDTHGWVMLKRGDVTEALSSLERASAESPNSRVILYHLGMAQLKGGQAEKARASLEAALAGGASFTGTDEARLALAQLNRGTG